MNARVLKRGNSRREELCAVRQRVLDNVGEWKGVVARDVEILNKFEWYCSLDALAIPIVRLGCVCRNERLKTVKNMMSGRV